MNDAAQARPAGPALAAAGSLDVAAITTRYESGVLKPTALVEGLLARIAARDDDHVWIDLLSRDDLMAFALRLESEGPAGKPLYGIPFAIKDNIDVAGLPTRAGSKINRDRKPSPRDATVFTIGGTQSACSSTSDIIIMISVTVLSAPGRSALFTTNMSPISIRPALIAWTAWAMSPPPYTAWWGSPTASLSSWPRC